MVAATSCFGAATAGARTSVKVEGIMNSSLYRSILAQNLPVSARKLKMERNFTFHRDIDSKHTSKSTKKWLHLKKINVLKWSSQNPDLNPAENLRDDQKRTVHWRCSHNLIKSGKILLSQDVLS